MISISNIIFVFHAVSCISPSNITLPVTVKKLKIERYKCLKSKPTCIEQKLQLNGTLGSQNDAMSKKIENYTDILGEKEVINSPQVPVQASAAVSEESNTYNVTEVQGNGTRPTPDDLSNEMQSLGDSGRKNHGIDQSEVPIETSGAGTQGSSTSINKTAVQVHGRPFASQSDGLSKTMDNLGNQGENRVPNSVQVDNATKEAKSRLSAQKKFGKTLHGSLGNTADDLDKIEVISTQTSPTLVQQNTGNDLRLIGKVTGNDTENTQALPEKKSGSTKSTPVLSPSLVSQQGGGGFDSFPLINKNWDMDSFSKLNTTQKIAYIAGMQKDYSDKFFV